MDCLTDHFLFLHSFECPLFPCIFSSVNFSFFFRQRIVKEQGLSKIEHYLYEEHDMLKRAATECICNLMLSPDVSVLKSFSWQKPTSLFSFIFDFFQFLFFRFKIFTWNPRAIVSNFWSSTAPMKMFSWDWPLAEPSPCSARTKKPVPALLRLVKFVRKHVHYFCICSEVSVIALCSLVIDRNDHRLIARLIGRLITRLIDW